MVNSLCRYCTSIKIFFKNCHKSNFSHCRLTTIWSWAIFTCDYKTQQKLKAEQELQAAQFQWALGSPSDWGHFLMQSPNEEQQLYWSGCQRNNVHAKASEICIQATSTHWWNTNKGPEKLSGKMLGYKRSGKITSYT